MVSLELDGRDLKEEEPWLALERRIADLRAELEQLRTEKEVEADRLRAIVAQARNELQNVELVLRPLKRAWPRPRVNCRAVPFWNGE